MDFSGEQRFIGVDVAYPRQDFLIKQNSLNGAILARQKPFNEFINREVIVKRLRADSLQKINRWYQRCGYQSYPAEFALVIKEKFAAVGKFKCHTSTLIGQLPH